MNFIFFFQQKFQREIDRLEQENRDLRKSIMLSKNKTTVSSRKMKVDEWLFF